MSDANSLLPCPFCGEVPGFTGSADDWQDDSRYVALSLTCWCDLTLTETIGWQRARDMTSKERAEELKARLTEKWNRRAASPVSTGADAKDAARYRWLRNRVVILDGSTAGMTIITVADSHSGSIVAQPLDRTIDNAIAAMSDGAV